jgi:hypothetical protein
MCVRHIAWPLGWHRPTYPPTSPPFCLQITMGTNYVGHFLLAHLLLERLRASSPSRVVWVVSPAEAAAKPDLSDPL